MRTILAILTLTALSTTALASEPDRCAADLARAEAAAYTATRTQHEAMDPAECRVAAELVRAATAQLESVRAMCATVPSTADPFESEAPAPLMAGVPEYTGDDAAFRAVMDQ